MGIKTRKQSDEITAARLTPGTEPDAEPRHCAECGRVPLIGERVARYAGEVVRCELCRTVCREQPVAEELVKHSPDGPRSRVRVIRRLPA